MNDVTTVQERKFDSEKLFTLSNNVCKVFSEVGIKVIVKYLVILAAFNKSKFHFPRISILDQLL